MSPKKQCAESKGFTQHKNGHFYSFSWENAVLTLWISWYPCTTFKTRTHVFLVGINQLFDVKTQAARVWYDHFGWPSWFYFWGSNIWQRQTIIHRLFGNFKALWAWLTVIWFYCTLFEEMSLVGIFNPETIVQNPSQRGLGPASGIQTWSSCQLIGLEKGWESSIVEPVPSFPRFTKLFFHNPLRWHSSWQLLPTMSWDKETM